MDNQFFNTSGYITGLDSATGVSSSLSYSIRTAGGSTISFADSENMLGSYYTGPSVKHGAIRAPKKKRGDKTLANDPSRRLTTLSAIAAYSFIKNRFTYLQGRKLTKRFETICKILAVAAQNGQIALKDSIEDRFGVMIKEQELIACGFTTYIEEALVKKFADRVRNKVVKITPIKNYVRIIPRSVLKLKEKADAAKLFDEYVVMHTDVNNTAVEKTRAEKKDPILFGLIRNSTKYYFVGDWEDELCDLTFSKIMEKLALEDKEVDLETEGLQDTIDKLLSIKKE